MVEFLPFQDLGAHLQIINLWRNVGADHGLMGQSFAVTTRPTPYLTYYGAVRLLSNILPLEQANRLLIGVYAISLPFAFLYLLSAYQRDYLYALFSFAFIYNTPLVYGFVPNAISFPIFMFCLGLLKRQLDSPRPWRELLLSIALLLLYFSHDSGFIAFAVVAPIVYFAHQQHPLKILRGGLFALPALLCALFWSGTSLTLTALKVEWATVPDSLTTLMTWINDIHLGRLDQVVLGMLGATFLLTLIASSTRPFAYPDRKGSAIAFAGLALFGAYLLIPQHIRAPVYQWMVKGRFAVPVAIMLLLIPRVRLQGRRRLLLVPAVAILLVNGLHIGRELIRFDRMARDIDPVIDAIPANRRVLPLYFDVDDGVHRGGALLHLPDLYQVRKGGDLGTQLIAEEVIPVHRTAPMMPAPIWWDPRSFSYERHGQFYDYILAIYPAGAAVPATLGGEQTPIQLLRRQGRFAVYVNTAAPNASSRHTDGE